MSKKPFDFLAIHRDPAVLLACDVSRQTVEGEVFSINFMNSEEIRQSILEDILAITMWEIQTESKIAFNEKELLRFVQSTSGRVLVKELLCDQFIQSFLDKDQGDQVRIKHDKLQEVMDYCGVYFSGYEMPEGVLIFDREAMDDKLEECGSVETLSKVVYIDSEANVPVPTNIH